MGHFYPKMALSKSKLVDIQQVCFDIGTPNHFVSPAKQFVSRAKQKVSTLQVMSNVVQKSVPSGKNYTNYSFLNNGFNGLDGLYLTTN